MAKKLAKAQMGKIVKSTLKNATNFANKNAQQEDLRHIVRFMNMDPKYSEYEVQQAFDK